MSGAVISLQARSRPDTSETTGAHTPITAPSCNNNTLFKHATVCLLRGAGGGGGGSGVIHCRFQRLSRKNIRFFFKKSECARFIRSVSRISSSDIFR